MKKNSSYMTRALQARDPRFADILGKLGHEAPEKKREEIAEEELTAVRAEYKEKMGKQAYHGWDADTIREKMAAD